MKNHGIHLSWIVVNDFDAALSFYTEVIGLTVKNKSSEHKWAELAGPEGSMLGISGNDCSSEVKPGSNAIVTITVENIEEAVAFFRKKTVKLLGDVQEIPGHVKLQMFADSDGNLMQLVQLLNG